MEIVSYDKPLLADGAGQIRSIEGNNMWHPITYSISYSYLLLTHITDIYQGLAQYREICIGLNLLIVMAGGVIIITILFLLDLVSSRVLYHHHQTKKQIKDNQPYLQLPIDRSGKSSKFLLSSTQPTTSLHCKTHQSLPNKILNILKNPFKQKYNYECGGNMNMTKMMVQYTNQDVVMTPVSFISGDVSGKGILGLGKGSEFFTSLPKNERVFAIWDLSSKGIGRGKASIGSYNPLLLSQPPISLFSSQKDPRWHIWMDSLSINLQPLQGIPAIFNFNYPHLGLPTTHYSKFFSHLSDTYQCKYNGQLFQCSCENYISNEFPTITFELAKQKFDIQPEQYIKIVDNTCHILIEPVLENPLIIGIPFFKAHMVVFGQNLVKVGRLMEKSLSEVIDWNIQERPTLNSILSVGAVLIMCILGTIVIIELVRRCSGLAVVKEETIHEIIVRGGGELT